MIDYSWLPLCVATLTISMKVKLMNVLAVTAATYELLTYIIDFASLENIQDPK
jgi:hypothetical protein